MKFKTTFLLLIVAFCLLICSCTNSSLSLNKVYVAGETEHFYASEIVLLLPIAK